MSSSGPGVSRMPSKNPAVDRALLPMVVRAFKVTSVAVFVWFWGYIGMSIAWIYVGLCFYIAGNECRKIKESKKMYAYQAIINEKEAILSRIDDHLSWVYFPDVEKAEWFNKILKQMWPYIDEYVRNLVKNSIEKSIQNSLPSSFNNFKFDTFDLGDTPIRIDGVKVYTDSVQKDEIVCDIDIRYSGDAKIKISVNNIGAGIKSLHLSGTMRVIMKPLVDDVPIVGGLSLFFLNRPNVYFDLTAAANLLDMPFLKKELRKIVEDQIARYLVLPNRIPVQLVSGVDISMLKYPAPQGVIEVDVVEARELKQADKNVFGSATSDPYCTITVGAKGFSTKVLKKTVQPVWDQRFTFIVDQKYGQNILIEVKDKDVTGTDDSLGLTSFNIETVAKKGVIDTWQQLEDVDTGSIHIRSKWLKLSSDLNDLKRSEDVAEKDRSSAVLIVFLDKAVNLPSGQSSKSGLNSFVRLTVGQQEQKSNVQYNSKNPCWNENFQFLLADPEKERITLEVKLWKEEVENAIVRHTIVERAGDQTLLFQASPEKKVAAAVMPINLLFTSENLTLDKVLPLSEVKQQLESSLVIRLTLRILKRDNVLHTIISSMTSTPPVEPKFEPIAAAETFVEQNSPMLQRSHTENNPEAAIVTKSSLSSDPPKVPVVTRSASAVTPATKDKRSTEIMHRSISETILGQIQLTLRYSVQRSHLVVVVHQCRNLIQIDKDHLANPYVRIYIHPSHSSSTKKKTAVVKSSLNPQFDETFEWPLTLTDLSSYALDIAVKNDIGLFSKSRTAMGHINLPLLILSDPAQPRTEWFDLTEFE